MTIIHFFTTAYHGGQSGKSTSAMMLMAQLCRPEVPSSFMAIIDMSYNAALYEKLNQIFGTPKGIKVAGEHPCFQLPTSSGHCQKYVIVVNPGKFLKTVDGVSQFFTKVKNSLPEYLNGASPDHILLETNLPQEAIDQGGFLDDIRGGVNSSTELYLWTTWLSGAISQRREYDRYHRLTINQECIRVFFIHNPFASTAGAPELRISQAMESCYLFGRTKEDYSPLQMWADCGYYASTTTTTQSGEDRWSRTYQAFSDQKARPINLLPVYMESNKLQRLSLPNGIQDTITCPEEFYGYIDFHSDGLCSRVYCPYFQDIGLK